MNQNTANDNQTFIKTVTVAIVTATLLNANDPSINTIDSYQLKNDASKNIYTIPLDNSIKPLLITSTSSTISSFSPVISFLREKFDSASVEHDEDVLYVIAESVSDWLINTSNESQTIFATYFKSASLDFSRILMTVLSDHEFLTSNENLLNYASLFVRSNDRWLAQTAAVFLLTCGDNLGEKYLSNILSQGVIHSQLIQGISKILG